jgi:hypothetical protein
MTNLYSWAVNQMTAYPEFAGQQDVVFQIAWVCSATDGTYNAAAYGTVDVTYVADSPYTPYDQITLEQANGWVAGALGKEGIAKAYADCDAAIADQNTQDKPVTPPLPWNVPTPAPEPEPPTEE